MPTTATSPASRFKLESRTKKGDYVTTLPYKDIQGEWLLNERGTQIRFSVPYIGYPTVTRANFQENVHEVWLYDNLVSTSDPIFAGPVWDITASSQGKMLSCSAQDFPSYLSSRYLRTSKTYSNTQVADDIVDLINYAKNLYPSYIQNVNVVKLRANATTSSKRYKAVERNKILDLIARLASMDDKVEFYSRMVNKVHQVYVYGGLIKPTGITISGEYGGILDGYSVQYNGQATANIVDVVNDAGRIGTASSTASQSLYQAVYEDVVSSDQQDSAALGATASQEIKDRGYAKVIPSIVTRKLVPIRDFDFGSLMNLVIQDSYVNVKQTVRITGWQYSISQNDNTTAVLYTKDNSSVS